MVRSLAQCAVVLLFVGCGSSNGPAPSQRDGDATLFESQVQPVLVKHCAFLGCHGREGMPLSIYALNYMRLRDPDGRIDPTRPALDERALTPAELDHNRQGLASRVGRDDPSGDIERFLQRLIPASKGGISHAGVVVFETPDDPDLQVLRQFLETVQ